MTTIDMMGKPCPMPVVEAKKVMSQADVDAVIVKVDNIVAVQNLEKMANGKGYVFSYKELSQSDFEVMMAKSDAARVIAEEMPEPEERPCAASPDRLVVVISKDSMGTGSEELGKILIKGFIYSLTELKTPPESVVFLNSGVILTSEGSNTIADIKKLEAAGCNIHSCGTCVNYFELQEKLAVGKITDMYGITEKMANASSIINI